MTVLLSKQLTRCMVYSLCVMQSLHCRNVRSYLLLCILGVIVYFITLIFIQLIHSQFSYHTAIA